VDLIERSERAGARHPWEVARKTAISQLVLRTGLARPRALDVGCGDAYLVRELIEAGLLESAVGQDVNLTPALTGSWSSSSLRLVQALDELGEERFELLLLLDVLEHVEDPATFLYRLVEARLAARGLVLVTVPAYQGLFTQHDRDLKHFRRYSRGEIAGVATAAGLRVLDSGYLFSSLLLPRALSAIGEHMRLPRSDGAIGVGGWRAPRSLTRFLTSMLELDNRVALSAHDLGITVPGLSTWLICSAPS